MVRIIKKLNELQDIKNDWQRLIELSDNNEIFLSYEWISLWLKYFLKHNELFIICIYGFDADSKIEAIAPFFISRFFLTFKVLKLIGDDFSDYSGFILNKSCNRKKIISQIFESIKNEASVDIVYLKPILEILKQEITDINAYTENFKLKDKESGDCYYVSLPQDLDGYIKKFKSKQRYNILKRVEKAEKNKMRYVSLNDNKKQTLEKQNESPHFYIEQFFNLHQKRWNAKGKRGVFDKNSVKAFFKDIFLALYKNNILALSFIEYNGSYIAGSACFDYNNKRQVYLPGFDPAYAVFHPGIVLTYYNINEAINKNYIEFDFLKGDEDYKKRFLGVKRKNYKLYLYKNSLIFYLFKINLFLNNEVKIKLKDMFLNILRKIKMN